MPPELAPESISFVKAWTQEHNRALDAKVGAYLQPPEKPHTFTLEQYVETVQERLLNQDFLPEQLLKDKLAYLEGLISILEAQLLKTEMSEEQKKFHKNQLARYAEGFKNFFPLNIEQVFAVIPFTDFGNGFSEEAKGKYEYFKRMYVMANGLTYGHTPTPAFYADLLPKEVREQCHFIPTYSSPDAIFPTLSELKKLRADMEVAFRNLKKILLPHIKQNNVT